MVCSLYFCWWATNLWWLRHVVPVGGQLTYAAYADRFFKLLGAMMTDCISHPLDGDYCNFFIFNGSSRNRGCLCLSDSKSGFLGLIIYLKHFPFCLEFFYMCNL
ncbi:hypothetical protein KFK09_002908 [Dendrobium nobile]|uniref:Secreted protein n=1 Tax=Dendrobium nobile TaxID=94219 RepID=A0A8T3C582_DENNO|nr:hypothetical protein KFK09_002908 [Dendrobium nobile]